MQLSIYFPKQVAIDNPRLWFLQNCVAIMTFCGVLFALLYTKVTYIRQVEPSTFIQAWVDLPVLPSDASDYGYAGKAAFEVLSNKVNSATSNFNYQPEGVTNGWKFDDPSMSLPCAAAALGESCMSVSDSSKMAPSTSIKDRSSDEALFIPTSYTEEFYNGATKDFSTPKSYLVPGVEDYVVKFIHHYRVKAPESYLHNVFGISREVKARLQVTIRKEDSDTRLLEFDQDEIVIAPVKTLLEGGGLSSLDSAQEAGKKFDPNTAPGGSITPRVTGVDLLAQVDYQGRIFERAPMAEVRLKASPTFVGLTETKVTGTDGSQRIRTYSGIRIRFVRMGSFEWFQFQAMVFGITTLLVWIRIPFMMVFYFAVYCLGSLSEVYSRFLYQDLNLHNEFNGVSSRLLKRSHGFSDLHDLVEQDGTRAISYSQSKKRMQRILEGRRELDEEEREYFTAFFFNNTATQMGDAGGNLAISMEDYLKAVSTEESLQYDDIMMFVDTDGTRLGCIEKLFIDGSLKKFVDSQENMKKRQSRAAGLASGEAPMAESESAPLTENQETAAAAAPTEETEAGKVRRSLDAGEARSASMSSGAGTRVTKMAEKQSVMFQMRMSHNTLTSQLDALQNNLEDLCRHKEQLEDRNNDYLHYLAHLNDQIRDASNKLK